MKILANGYDVGSVIQNISLADPSKRFIPDKTIILFDEIQDNPDVATTLTRREQEIPFLYRWWDELR